MSAKIYTVKHSKAQGTPVRREPDRVRFMKGTAHQIANYYGAGSMKDRPIGHVIKLVQKMHEQQEAACYNRTSVELVTEVPEGSAVRDLTEAL